jgi:sulfur carrier protein ThiS
MLHLALLTLTLATGQALEIEVSRTLDEYLAQLGLTPTRHAVVISDWVPEGAAVLHVVNAAGEDTALFMFERGLLLELTKQERKVLIGHEVAHLAPECQYLWARIYRELCADAVSLKLLPVEDVSAMLFKSLRMFPYYPARQEFRIRLAMIRQARPENRGEEHTVVRSSGSSRDDWMVCA